MGALTGLLTAGGAFADEPAAPGKSGSMKSAPIAKAVKAPDDEKRKPGGDDETRWLDPALPVETQWSNYKAAAIKFYGFSPEQVESAESIYNSCTGRLAAAQKADSVKREDPKGDKDNQAGEKTTVSAVSKLTDEFVYRIDAIARMDQVSSAASEGFVSPRKRAAATNPNTGNAAPEFTLNTREGKPVSLSQLRGKVVVLTFWASWCGYCKKTLPGIESLYQKYKDNPNVEILGIDCREKEDDNSKALAILKEKDYHFPVLFKGDPAAASYEVAGFPTLFVIDQSGQIIHKQRGHRDAVEKIFAPIIDAALAGKPAPDAAANASTIKPVAGH